MTTLAVAGPAAVRGRVRVPGDKSISHRALLLGALAEGTTTITGLSAGEDVAHTRDAVAALGADVLVVDDGRVQVTGGGLRAPATVVDVGNSGTGLRLLMGVTAALEGTTRFDGDDSIRRRPMDRVAVPLRRMGATIEGVGDRCTAPLAVTGGTLNAIDYELPVASAQVKGSVLLAGLGADGETVEREHLETRAHTEEMLAAFGADVRVERGEGTGSSVHLRPGRLTATDVAVPGDPSQAAFWIAAACLVPGSDVTVEGVYLGPARNGFLTVLARMGADVEVDTATGDVRARHSALHGTEVTPDEIPGLVDEVPILAVAAAAADGPTRFLGAGELRVKESDRLSTVASELGALGARVEARPDELVVAGGGHLRPGRVTAHGDHRIAMAGAIAALAAAGETEIDGWEVVATSYPGFEDDLETLTRS
ncbi:MAG TPA: 3-phosphoshikimate 1-carboxyvinyltransferase [Acidimicrobiales bacterium]|nr:3-phosphoshikimate 1-carboxyvinyltransferase [Acidimicrobiales bacterium]